MLDLPLALAQDVTPWFDQPALVGAIGGSAIGVLGGGIYGPLVGLLAPRGGAKALVFAYHFILLGAGVVLLGAGVVALAVGQPYAVYYPLLLGGLLMSVLFGLLTPVLVQRYRAAEHRRLEAEEFRRGGAAAGGRA